MALPARSMRDASPQRFPDGGARSRHTEIRDRCGTSYRFTPVPAPGGPARRSRFLGPEDARRFLRRFALDAPTLAAFRGILPGLVVERTDREPGAVAQRVAEALASGALAVELATLVRPDPRSRYTGGPDRVAGVEAPPDDEEPAPERAAEPVLTWIEVQLIGEDDLPVAGEPYRLTLASGRVIEGTLNSEGLVRLEQMLPGSYDLTFPRLDREAWAHA